MKTLLYILHHEKIVLFSFLFFILLSATSINPSNQPLWLSGVMFLVIFAVMLFGVFNVVKHAHILADRLGEPYGTLVLTLAVIIVEVALIMSVMLAGKAAPTLARDTMFSVLMIAINGFAGLSLLVGGIKHKSQQYHLGGANAYLALLIPLSIMCFVLPNEIAPHAHGALLTSKLIIVAIICVVLYATFLLMQTVTHVEYFKLDLATENEINEAKECYASSMGFHVVFLILSLLAMILLSKKLAVYLDYSLSQAGLPIALGGFIIALLILVPEGYSAVYSSLRNRLQRSVNLCLGSVVASICLTIPAVAIISLLMHVQLVLGLSAKNVTLLWVTLLLCVTTFTSKETNFLNGAVHIAVLCSYFTLLFF